MFPVIILFSNIGIDLYSSFRKNLIVTPKICEKIDRSHTRLQETNDLFLSQAKLHGKKPPFCLCVYINYM